MLYYCKKCGRIVQEDYGNKEQKCDYCQSSLYPVPNEYTIEGLGTVVDKDLKEQFINEYIKSSPEFDPDLFEHRDEDLNNRRRENEAKIAHGKAILEGTDKGNKFSAECPYCHSTNTKKISTFSKVWSMHWLGMYSIGSIAKEWHCNNCNSDF